MKKFILNYILLPILLFVIFNAVAITILSWSGPGIKDAIIKNIETAKEKYDGKAEDALISYLLDETNTPHQRSNVAIWTLGKIKSQKALPYLEELYLNDPKGSTCMYRHDSVICQHRLYNAITDIESKRRMHPEFNQ